MNLLHSIAQNYSVVNCYFCWIYGKISQAQNIKTLIVEESMGINISKKKRDDLLDKIRLNKKIAAYQ